jgi:predicted translin family RNA/ssDNA-binding protein
LIELRNLTIQKRLDAEQKQELNQQLLGELQRECRNQVTAVKKANSDAASSQKKRKRNEDGHPAGMIVTIS